MVWTRPGPGCWKKRLHLWILAGLWGLIIIPGLILAIEVIAFLVTSFSPVFDYDLSLPSPDGRYDLIVIREDRSALDDFYYRVFIFPHAAAPVELSPHTLIRWRGIWRDNRYLTYAGYAFPSVRWTSPHEVRIDIDDLYPQISEFYPVPGFNSAKDDSSSAVLVSLLMNQSDPRDTIP